MKKMNQVNFLSLSLDNLLHLVWPIVPAFVAQLDAHLTDDQEVAGLTPWAWQHSFMEIWSWNFFYGHSLSSTDSGRVVVSFWQKNVYNTG